MVRLQHSDITQVRSPEKARPFHTLGVTPFVSRVMLGSALAFGVGAVGSSLFLPRTAMAQDDELTLKGMSIDKVEMGERIASLKRRSNIRTDEGTDERSTYSNLTFIPNQFSALFILPADSMMMLRVNMPGKRFDKQFDRFRRAVEEYTGQKLTRVLNLIEEYKDPGTKEKITSTYAFALDSSGSLISYRGGYLGVVASYYHRTGELAVGNGVILEPGMVLAIR